MLNETCKPYDWETDFYKHHNIPLWECKTHETYNLGTIIKKEDGSYIKAKVSCWPAQFWEFEVYSFDSSQTTVIHTGSGGLSKHLEPAIAVMEGMFVVKSITPTIIPPVSGESEQTKKI